MGHQTYEGSTVYYFVTTREKKQLRRRVRRAAIRAIKRGDRFKAAAYKRAARNG